MKRQIIITSLFLLFSNSIYSQAFEVPKDYKLIVVEDYAPYEQDVIDGVNWLINTPVNQEQNKRAELNTFLIKWLTGSPDVMVTIDSEIITFMDNPDCFMIFMGGWAKRALETGIYRDNLRGNIAGIESVIEFYKKNEKILGKIKGIQKYIKLQKKNKLEDYIKSKIKY